MTDDGGMFAESIAAAGEASAELRQLIREAHEARADLRDARRDLEAALILAKAYIEVSMPDSIRDIIHGQITEAVAAEMERLRQDIDKTIDKSKEAINKSFARLFRHFMYGTETPDETTPSLFDMATTMRVQRGLQPGHVMPAAFGPRKQAGGKPKR